MTSKIIMWFITSGVARDLFLQLADYLVARTDNTIDDKLVGEIKDALNAP
jgi:hypothetical protein